MQKTTDRAQLIDLYAKIVDMFCATPPADASRYIWRSTSGTTNRGSLHAIYPIAPSALARHADTERLLIAMAPLNTRLLNMLLVRNGSSQHIRAMCIDPKDVHEGLVPIIEDFAPDGLFGGVSFIATLVTKLRIPAFKRLRKLMLTGEYVTPTLRDLYAKHFPHLPLTQMYGTTEVAQISTPPCGYLPLNAHHIIPEVDISLQGEDENGVGTVLMSWDIVPGVRVDGYAPGDVGMLLHALCACGEKTTLTLMGRSGFDYIKLAGIVLHRAEFDRVALLCADLIDDYRAEAYTTHEDGVLRGSVILHAYRKRGALSDEERAELGRRFSSEVFVTPTQTFEDIVGKGALAPLIVENVAEPFPVQNKLAPLRLRDV